MEDLSTECEAAARIARSAGRALVALRAAADGDGDLRDRADSLAHRHITAALAEAFPGDAVLSEEAADDRRRLDAERVWIVDPLDGTREYGEGRSDWAVHVALWVRGELRAGAVALPALDEVHATTPGGVPETPAGASPAHPRMVVSRSRAHPLVLAAAAALGAQVIPLGSAGAKAMAVVAGRAELYAHAGGQYEWDSAAPVVVARTAGLHASRLDGAPLRYNRADPWLPDVLVCRPELAEAALGAVAAAAAG